MKYLLLLGRILFASVFVLSSSHHFSGQTISYAAAQGVPLAKFLVPFSGIMELVGGISIILGYKAKWGGWLIILFLIPVTFAMHAFWKVSDPMQAQMAMAMFMKNTSMLGAAFIIAYFGSDH